MTTENQNKDNVFSFGVPEVKPEIKLSVSRENLWQDIANNLLGSLCIAPKV